MDSAGYIPLELAIANRRHFHVEHSISHGTDLEKSTTFSGIALPVAPPMGAVTMDDWKIVKNLIRKGADINKPYANLSPQDSSLRYGQANSYGPQRQRAVLTIDLSTCPIMWRDTLTWRSDTPGYSDMAAPVNRCSM